MTQLLLLVTVLGGVGSLIAFVMVMPNRIRTTALELGNEIKLLTVEVGNLRRTLERIEGENADLEERVRKLELEAR